MDNVITLNNGVHIPRIGFGGWAQDKRAILSALKAGYRLIDTASQYNNEDVIGEAIRKSGINRRALFLTTKLWTEDIRNKRTRDALYGSLRRLGTDYIDMYLIHWPAENFEEAWRVMETLYKEGTVRVLGVSNFEEHHLNELTLSGAEIIPAVNQIESHPYFSNQTLIDAQIQRGIYTQAWCPLGGPNSRDLQDPRILDIAGKYHVTPAQIVLRWHLQRNVLIIPKSTNMIHMKSNFDLFNINLCDSDMHILDGMDTSIRLGPHPDTFDF